tara:strand:+ start:4942 stop:5514 length:573 start_codon:yes stop_codon:yes gene_type:complete
MSISIYKPTAKNTGSGFSFQIGLSSSSGEPALFVKSILQHSWDDKKKQGYFKDNQDNPDKNIIVKFSEFEVGHIIHAFRTRCTYKTFHAFGSDKTSIKFMPWAKKAKESFKNDDGEWVQKWIEVPAFSVSFIRNGNQNFVIGLDPGEVETVMEFMQFYLNHLFSYRLKKQLSDISKSKREAANSEDPPPF